MNQDDANRAHQLYGMVGSIDQTLEHISNRTELHAIDVHIWASSADGNYEKKINVADDAEISEELKKLMREYFLRKRRVMVDQLSGMGFDPPAEPVP